MQGFEGAGEVDEGGVPVDGDLVGGIGAVAIKVGCFRFGVRIVLMILATGVGAAGEETGDGWVDAIGNGRSMVGVLGGMAAEAGDETFIQGVAPEKIIEIGKSRIEVFAVVLLEPVLL